MGAPSKATAAAAAIAIVRAMLTKKMTRCRG